jgi:hypothetical protein
MPEKSQNIFIKKRFKMGPNIAASDQSSQERRGLFQKICWKLRDKRIPGTWSISILFSTLYNPIKLSSQLIYNFHFKGEGVYHQRRYTTVHRMSRVWVNHFTVYTNFYERSQTGQILPSSEALCSPNHYSYLVAVATLEAANFRPFALLTSHWQPAGTSRVKE